MHSKNCNGYGLIIYYLEMTWTYYNTDYINVCRIMLLTVTKDSSMFLVTC